MLASSAYYKQVPFLPSFSRDFCGSFNLYWLLFRSSRKCVMCDGMEASHGFVLWPGTVGGPVSYHTVHRVAGEETSVPVRVYDAKSEYSAHAPKDAVSAV